MSIYDQLSKQFGITSPTRVLIHFERVPDSSLVGSLDMYTEPNSITNPGFLQRLALLPRCRDAFRKMVPKRRYTISVVRQNGEPTLHASHPDGNAQVLNFFLPHVDRLARDMLEHAERIQPVLPKEDDIRKRIMRALDDTSYHLMRTGMPFRKDNPIVRFPAVNPEISTTPETVVVYHYLDVRATNSPFLPAICALIERATREMYPSVLADYALERAKRSAAEAAFYADMHKHVTS